MTKWLTHTHTHTHILSLVSCLTFLGSFFFVVVKLVCLLLVLSSKTSLYTLETNQLLELFPFLWESSLLPVSFEEQKFKNFLVVLFNNYFLLGIVFVVSNPNSQEFYLIFSLEVMQFCFLFWIMVSFKLIFFNVRWEMTQSNFLACVDTIIPAPFVKKEKKRSVLHWIVFIGQKLVDCTCSSLFLDTIFSFDILDAKHLSKDSTSWFFIGIIII